MNDEEKKQLQLLQQLDRMEQFKLWREMVVEPELQNLENALNEADNLPEPILRAKLKHINSLKHFFYGVFTQVDVALEQEQK